MRIIMVGASGTIGRSIHEELATRHEVITASANNGDIKVDISSRDSIQAMYDEVGTFDALVNAVGNAYFGPFETMTETDMYVGIRSKMMGQINLVMIGKNYINDNGSFTLITGILADEPIRMGAGLSTVNGAVNAFVMAAAVELQRGIRINVVSPGMVEDSLEKYGPYFPGHNAVPMQKVVNAYLKSVEGVITGQVIRV